MKTVLALGTIMLGLCGSVDTAKAQAECDTVVQLGAIMVPVGLNNTLDTANTYPAHVNTPSFYFEYWNAQARFRYQVSDVRKNSTRIPLQTWCRESFKNYIQETDSVSQPLTNRELSDSSRSYPFVIQATDTVEVLRTIWWHKKQAAQVCYDSSYTSDSLFWTIELRKQSDGSRIALLDSILIPKKTEYGLNPYYSMMPIPTMILRYTHPAQAETDTAYIQFNVNSIGDSNFRFSRHDTYKLNGRGKYLAPLTKTPAQQNNVQHESGTADLTVRYNQGSRSVEIRLGEAHSGTTIQMFDIRGALLQEQFVPAKEQTLSLTPRNNGVFMIVAKSSEAHIAKQITVY